MRRYEDRGHAEMDTTRVNVITSELAAGNCAVLLDSDGAVLFFAAEAATAKLLHFAIRNSSGLIHAALPSTLLDRLRIHDQPVLASENSGVRFTVAVDAVDVGTGISGRDRARTLRTLACPQTDANDIQRPGHILPIRCEPLNDEGSGTVWDAALASVKRAGLTPAAGVCRLVHDGGDVLDGPAAREFSKLHAIPVLSPQYHSLE